MKTAAFHMVPICPLSPQVIIAGTGDKALLVKASRFKGNIQEFTIWGTLVFSINLRFRNVELNRFGVSSSSSSISCEVLNHIGNRTT